MKDFSKREKLADILHQIWIRWMDYQFKRGTFNNDGSWTMHYGDVSYWRRLMKIPYENLSTIEKMSDQEIADEIIEKITT